ncbi:glycosyltransferase family 2 protein [Candidatus Peregrinibacteria bacterium]|nr:glycosyltransferase family 2 protein [Candidatus Peregrinibacteria bacterium]
MLNGKHITAVVPAFNTERTIERTLAAIDRTVVDLILVVNDGSRDRTVEIAERLGARVVTHEKNKGYGAAQKTGYATALQAGADVVVMVHSDFQYDPTLNATVVAPIVRGEADACFGSRMHSKRSALQGGMPLWRFVANIALTFIEDCVLRLHLSEYHTGYRAYSRRTLERIPMHLNSNNYVFDTEMIAQLRAGNCRVAEVPIPTRYLEDSCSPTFRQSVRYGFNTLHVLWKYLMHRFRLHPSAQFEVGSGPGLQAVLTTKTVSS